MHRQKHMRTPRFGFSRQFRIYAATLALAASAFAVGCQEEDARAFRAAAATSLESGIKTIFDGLVEGAFAVFDQGTDQPADTTATAATGG